MIQAVADDQERGALGMHYTSVPNIPKVLNPLFLDDLRAKLVEAGENLGSFSTCGIGWHIRVGSRVRLWELPRHCVQGDARDLDSIIAYIALDNPAPAEKVFRAIADAAGLLSHGAHGFGSSGGEERRVFTV